MRAERVDLRWGARLGCASGHSGSNGIDLAVANANLIPARNRVDAGGAGAILADPVATLAVRPAVDGQVAKRCCFVVVVDPHSSLSISWAVRLPVADNVTTPRHAPDVNTTVELFIRQ